MRHRTVQETFVAVLQSGNYNSSTPYMCHVVNRCYGLNIITHRQSVNALAAIRGYLTHTSTLISGLLDLARRDLEYEVDHLKVNNDYEALCKMRIQVGEAIYGDWDNRPMTPVAARAFIAKLFGRE